jgi:hypothetical protein
MSENTCVKALCPHKPFVDLDLAVVKVDRGSGLEVGRTEGGGAGAGGADWARAA